MANALYPSAKVLMETTGLGDASGTYKLAAVNASYVYSSAHDFFNDITNQVGSSVALSSVTTTNGKFTSADVVFTDIPNTNVCNAVILYKDTGTPSTSSLVGYWDTGTNFPITSNGGSITISPNGTNGWFTL